MKKFFFVLALFSTLLQAQEKSEARPYIIKHCEGTSQYFGDKGLICSTEMKNRWFVMIPDYNYEKGELSVGGFLVLKMDIGKCSKEDWIIVTFKGGSKVTLRSSNKEISCENEIYFPTSVMDNQSLALKSIDTIRYINGNDLRSYTYYLSSEESTFFINAYNNFVIVKTYCKP